MKRHWIFYSPHVRHFHAAFSRGLHALMLVLALTGFGTAAIKYLEKMTWIDALYFTSMLVTAQGPALVPTTVGGKLFASLFSFLAVGVGFAAIGYIFGPFAADLWRTLSADHPKKNRQE